jgi:hypothetical protein
MRDRLLNLWNAIPAPIRTVLNVAIAGGITVICAAVIRAQGVTDVDWAATGEAALNAVGLGLATAAWRALNPLDSAYGIERGTDETTPGH